MSLLDFSGRYYAYTDLRWVGSEAAYGVSTENINQSYGTGLTPSAPADAHGYIVKAGEVISDIYWQMERNNAQITAAFLTLIHRAIDGTITFLYESLSLALTGNIAGQRDFTGGQNITIPADGELLLAIKPVGTATATRYIYANIQIRLTEQSTGGADVASEYSQAIADGRAFSAFSEARPVHSEKHLEFTFTNPTGSGKDCYIIARKLGCNRPEGSRTMNYSFEVGASPDPSSVAVRTVNRLTGGADTTMEVMIASVDDAIEPTGFLVNGGHLLNIDDEVDEATRIVTPGNSFQFTIGSFDYNDEDKARIVMTWYEKDAA